MRPCELCELEAVVPLLERTNEEDETYASQWNATSNGRYRKSRCTNDIEHEANESMMGCERQEYSINENYVLEVVNDALSVEEVHGRPQEIPVE